MLVTGSLPWCFATGDLRAILVSRLNEACVRRPAEASPIERAAERFDCDPGVRTLQRSLCPNCMRSVD